jgi:hypothetical protein
MRRVVIAVMVTIVVDGVPIQGSRPARLCDNVVMAPLAPYLRDIADRTELDADGTIVITRDGSSISVSLGSRTLRAEGRTAELRVAPFSRTDEPFVPLAAVARALGVAVSFDTASKTLELWALPRPLASFVPDPTYTPPAYPLEVFTPNPTPAPKVIATGAPKPRRTPIVLENGNP